MVIYGSKCLAKTVSTFCQGSWYAFSNFLHCSFKVDPVDKLNPSLLPLHVPGSSAFSAVTVVWLKLLTGRRAITAPTLAASTEAAA